MHVPFDADSAGVWQLTAIEFRKWTSERLQPSVRGASMLGPAIVSEIRRLLGEGRLSQRAIARRMGVSRGMVHAIAHGKRHNRTPRGDVLPGLLLSEAPWERCPGCGGRVQMPCVLCRIRAAQQRRKLSLCGCP